VTDQHYHVICIQDFGGTQESGKAWEDQRTWDQAVEFARDCIEADTGNRVGWYHQDHMPATDEDHVYAKFSAKYGDKWNELLSDNVAPGWDAVFIRPCTNTDGECDPWKDSVDRYTWKAFWRADVGELTGPCPGGDDCLGPDGCLDVIADDMNTAREYMLQLDPEPRRALLTQMLAELDPAPAGR
jgi:hypothetical protein